MTAIDLFDAAPSSGRNLVETVLGLLRSLLHQRRQRLALRSLLEMDPARLYDLGVTPGDVLEALSEELSAGARLERSRAARTAG